MLYEARWRTDTAGDPDHKDEFHHQDRTHTSSLGAFDTSDAAYAAIQTKEAFLSELHARKSGNPETDASNERYWARISYTFWVEEIDNSGLFQTPPELTPPIRERYYVETENMDPGGWGKTRVKVFAARSEDQHPIQIAEYERNYAAMIGTFEPFRQRDADGNWHNYALISPNYTITAVLDLDAYFEGRSEHNEAVIVASEEVARFGFCPTYFYVPDWWDCHDDSIRPGTLYWDEKDERPDGSFGFVSGCIWGDDNSWKLQYLDLSRVAEGIITRDERFGYIELAGHWDHLKDVVTYWSETDMLRVAVEVGFSRKTGKANSWARDNINWGDKELDE